MKRILMVFVLYSGLTFGQTFTGDVTLFTQEDINSFGADNYTIIDGNVSIGDPDGSDVTNLSALSSWQIITGFLAIDNTALANLNGLNNLISIGPAVNPGDEGTALYLQSNTSLTDISALSGISSLAGIDINFNQNLNSLDGLQNVVETTEVRIRQNSSLVDFTGLDALSNIYGLTIENNAGLINLNGLQNLQGPLHFIKINDNPELLSLNAISQLASGPGFYGETITNNAKLTNFCGLFQLLNTAPESASLNITGNAQNPTQQNIIDGGPCASYTTIPDDNFEAFLIAENIDTEQIADNRILTSDALSALELDISSYDISDFQGLQAFSNITLFSLINNQAATIQEIDFSGNLALETITLINTPNVPSVDISQNNSIVELSIVTRGNLFSDINLTGKNSITLLQLADNQISNIDLSGVPNLLNLSVAINPMTSVDISSLTALESIATYESQITNLDLSQNPNLTSINSHTGALTSVNIKNGFNDLLALVEFTGNPSLSCIEVDNVAFAEQETTNGTWVKDVTASYQLNCEAGYTAIPDDNFEAYLIAQNIDTEQIADNRVLTSDISTLVTLDVRSQNISDLTGIEGFSALQTLLASSNSISAIDLQQNDNLEILEMVDNNLSNINLGSNTELVEINLGGNSISAIDISSNTNLESLSLTRNSISSIDISSNILLRSLFINENNLTTIDIAENDNLRSLNISQNPISIISVLDKPSLTLLDVSSTNLETLDISQNPNLFQLLVQSTLISALDLSNNANLEFVFLYDNPNLNTLNVANGNNTSLSILDTSGNPNLICIQVDDVNYSNQQVTNDLWIKDTTTEYLLNCFAEYTAIPDDNFEQALIDLGIDTNPTLDNQVLTSAIETVTFLNLTGDPVFNTNPTEIGLNIQSLEGIKAFTSLDTLWAQGNQLTELDLENMVTLTDVRGFINQLTSINFNGLSNLEIVGLNRNQITSVDLGTNTNLIQFDIAENNLQSLDLTANTMLALMNVQSNPNLNCIQVLDPTEAQNMTTLGNWRKDTTAQYALNCNTTATVEFSQASGGDLEALGGNLPRLLITGTINNPTTITIDDVTMNSATDDGVDYTFGSTPINIPIGTYDGTINTSIAIPTLSIVDDTTYENREEINLQLSSFTGDISAFGMITTTVYFINEDDYTASIAAVELTASEEGLVTAQYAVLLNAAVEFEAVSVNYSIGGTATNGTDYEVLNGTVTIQPGGSNTADIIITPIQDLLVEGPEEIVLTLTDGIQYNLLAPIEATVTIEDNDFASYAVSKNTVATSEPNITDSFSVVLDAQPMTDVVIDIASDNIGEAIASPASLTFTNSNWNEAQTVTVAGQDEPEVDGIQNYSIIVSVNNTASDDEFAFADLADIIVNGTNADDDIAGAPGFAVSKNIIVTAEPNGTDSFSVVLNVQPTSDVVINLVSNNTEEALLAPESLTFTTTNWNEPQNIIVTGQDDSIVDGPIPYVITLSIDDTNSADEYATLADLTVNGTNQDNETDDAPGITLSKNSVVTSEPNNTDTFTAVLDSRPIFDVVILVSSDTPAEALTSVPSLTFTATNWNTPQTITVIGQDDTVVDGAIPYTITLSIDDANSDDVYDTLEDLIVSGINQDDETSPNPILMLDDISVIAKNATCPGVNNGSISISTTSNYNFVFSVAGVNSDYSAIGTINASTAALVENLAKGQYEACVTISEFPDWEQCFGINITNYEDLNVFSTDISTNLKTATYIVQGSEEYNIRINDKIFLYTFENIGSNVIEVPLEDGLNQITILGDADCQGKFEDIIELKDFQTFPNPVISDFHITTSSLKGRVKLTLANISGTTIKTIETIPVGGVVRIDCSELSAGLYVVYLKSKTKEESFKILKL